MDEGWARAYDGSVLSAWAENAGAHDGAFAATDSDLTRPQYEGVPLLRWPAEQERAAALEQAGLPFLCLVSDHGPPPINPYPLTDWVRSPIDGVELIVRRTTLENRYLRGPRGPRPCLDESGRLCFLRACVDLTPSQVPVVAVLLDAYPDIVDDAALRDAFGVASAHVSDSFKGGITRLRRRVRRVGLDIRRAPGVGFALEPADRS